jgi:hypothetical protein
MSNPLNLPENPTNADLARGLVQTHECLEAARGEIRQTTNALVVLKDQNELMMPTFVFLTKVTKYSRRFSIWIISIVTVAYVTVIVQNQVNHNDAADAARQAAINAKAAATASNTVVGKLNSLGAP